MATTSPSSSSSSLTTTLSTENRCSLPPVNGSFQQYYLQTGTSAAITHDTFKERDFNLKTICKAQKACTKLIQDASTSKGVSTLYLQTQLGDRFTSEEVLSALMLLDASQQVISNQTCMSSKEDRKDRWYRWKGAK